MFKIKPKSCMSNARKMKFINYISKVLVEYLRGKFRFLGEFTIRYFFPRIHHPSGLPSLPNLPRCQGLEVSKYVCVPSALHLRQTRQLQDLGKN